MSAELDKSIACIRGLIAFDTTPDQPTTPLLDYTEDFLRQHGVTCHRTALHDGRHGVLLARIGPDVDGGCVLSGHIDVVPVTGQAWATDPFALHDDGNRLYGRGACDMKGFVGCVLSMVPYWQQAGLTKPIYIALTCDEETSVESIYDVLRLIEGRATPKIAILGEPTGMEIIAAHKGAQEFVVDIKGMAAHASRPDLGKNAINMAGRLIGFTEKLQADLKEDVVNDSLFPPYATVSVGMIKGGNAMNTVAEHCCMNWNVRQITQAQTVMVANALDKFIADAAADTANPTLSYRQHIMPALELRCDNPAIVLAKHVLGVDETKTAPFATEAGYYQAADIDCIVCGPGSIEQAHRPDEYVDIDQIEKCLAFLRGLAQPHVQAML